jgi:hypothetical protein
MTIRYVPACQAEWTRRRRVHLTPMIYSPGSRSLTTAQTCAEGMEIYVDPPNWRPRVVTIRSPSGSAKPNNSPCLRHSVVSDNVGVTRRPSKDRRAEILKGLVASLFGNSLRSFRPFLADGRRIAAAAGLSLNFPSLDAITPFDLDAWDGKWDSYRWSLLYGRPILRTGRQRSCGNENGA